MSLLFLIFSQKLIAIKKLISILILLVFLGNYLGITAFFLFERKAARKNAEKVRVQNIDNQTVELSLGDYYNVLEEENEIVLNGEFFDISTKKIVNDRIILSGHYDENETKLIDWFDGLPNKKDIQTKIYNFLNSLFFVQNSSFHFGLIDKFSQKYHFNLLQYISPTFLFYHPPKM